MYPVVLLSTGQRWEGGARSCGGLACHQHVHQGTRARVHVASMCRVQNVSNVYGDCILLLSLRSSVFIRLLSFLSSIPFPSQCLSSFSSFCFFLAPLPFPSFCPLSHPFPASISLSLPVLSVLPIFPFLFFPSFLSSLFSFLSSFFFFLLRSFIFLIPFLLSYLSSFSCCLSSSSWGRNHSFPFFHLFHLVLLLFLFSSFSFFLPSCLVLVFSSLRRRDLFSRQRIPCSEASQNLYP